MEELLTRGIDRVIGQEELVKLAAGKRKLRIKFGVDPTRPDIHLGHSVVLRKLREFQAAGHTVIFLIGDYTTKIGDPSGRNTTRPVLTDSEIKANAKTYLDQVGAILNINKAEIRYNSEWLSKLDFSKLIHLAAQVSVAQIIEREDFDQRLKSGQELALHELLYPLMQAYDSVMLNADVEFGGTDQLFNLLMGRSLQKKMGQEPQAVITVPLLVGLDGSKKMSKSLDNYVGITQEPQDMYGRIMSLSDHLIAPYYDLCTDIPQPVIADLVKSLATGANPRDAKASLAREIVRIYHGEAKALAAEDAWNATFRDKSGPSKDMIQKIMIKKSPITLIDFLIDHDIRSSRSQVRTLIEQGGIRINGQPALELDTLLSTGDEVNIGRKDYYKLSLDKAAS